MTESDILKWAAARAAEDAMLLGFDLHEYRNLHSATEDELASVLQCSRGALVCLALCRRPDPNASSFAADVQQISSHCGANAQRLANLLREVDSMRTLREMPSPPPIPDLQTGFLAAARDRKKKKKRTGEKRGPKASKE